LAVLVISCSPRKNGNTELLLEHCLKGLADANVDGKFVRLQEFHIKPCRECLSCHITGKCVINDDMQGFYPQLITTQGLIIGSPIFFMGIPAKGKAFIDRCQPFWAKKYLIKEKSFEKKHRIGGFLSLGGTTFSYLFDGAVRTIKSFFKVIDIDYKEELLIKGIDQKGEILEHPEILELSHKLGFRIGEAVKKEEKNERDFW